ncbi:MAG: TerD family protein [Thermoguttaceae bacterium]|nr:TerD family protein [Thermoguttaceae bacterium]
MAVSLLKKGEQIELNSGLKNIRVGLGWRMRETAGDNFDLDVCAFMLGRNGKVRSDADFIFYNQLKSRCGCVEHMGDNLVGGTGNNDDETVKVSLVNLAADVEKIVFTTTIHKARERRQNFGMVGNAYIRIVDDATTEEIAKFELAEDAGTNQAVVFGELYRHNGVWKFRAVGQGVDADLYKIAVNYGVNVK